MNSDGFFGRTLNHRILLLQIMKSVKRPNQPTMKTTRTDPSECRDEQSTPTKEGLLHQNKKGTLGREVQERKVYQRE